MPEDFRVDDLVYKPKGYRFPGVVRSVFTTFAGATRYVVEMNNEREQPTGMLHIFSASQLALQTEEIHACL